MVIGDWCIHDSDRNRVALEKQMGFAGAVGEEWIYVHFRKIGGCFARHSKMKETKDRGDLMNQNHALVIGGTGMLRGVCLWLTEQGYVTSVIGRSGEKH